MKLQTYLNVEEGIWKGGQSDVLWKPEEPEPMSPALKGGQVGTGQGMRAASGGGKFKEVDSPWESSKMNTA